MQPIHNYADVNGGIAPLLAFLAGGAAAYSALALCFSDDASDGINDGSCR